MPNRLAEETSPYLRLHAEDPVDWYPWGQEAFDRARETGRPIFLSVGYASCHWCHVMHRESFLDPAVAEALNERFVSVKVDREARPDVDEVYMAYVVAANGHGGWPMTVFLTPSLLPVFGGTYFPPEAARNMPSFLDVLDTVSGSFGDRPSVAANTAEEAVEYLRAMFVPLPAAHFGRALLARSAQTILRSADPHRGGFGGAPKFPQAPVTDFLLAYHDLSGDEVSLEAVEAQAEGMLRGGIYDQAGGGIARYSTDDTWLVPHFEKMLYDNAQLLSTLAGLHRLAPRDEWAHAMRATAEFIERDLRIRESGYASSLSADTQGEEGQTYVWTYPELEELLTSQELLLAEMDLGVTPTGNWQRTIILTRPQGRLENAEHVDAVLGKLFEARQMRPQPDLDDKVLVSWNALAARGLLDAGEALDDDVLKQRGASLVQLLLDRAVDTDGGVVHLLCDEASADVRLVEDAAALSLAAVRAYEVLGEREFLEASRRVLRHAAELFAEDGVWYMTPPDTELPLRPREQHDSPTPTGAAMAANAAHRISEATGDATLRALAQAALERMTPIAERSPFSAGATLAAMANLLAEESVVSAGEEFEQ